MPSLSIDGREANVPEGTTAIQAAETLGIFIPRYCYHPGLSVAGNCRICLVDVEQFPKLQIACNLPVTEGMVVDTRSDKAEEGRRAVLEFLLANHPLDCPVCDQSGECDLQDFYMNFGLYNPRFKEYKVKKRKALELGPHVMLDQERCILCSRCVRFTDEITKTSEFGIFNRGDRAELGLCPGEVLDNPYSANVVDICPVGALTESDFRFKARVWYLSSASTVCNGCSQGCNMDLHFVLDRPHLNDGARVVRIKPRYNPDVNQWWLCDEGRYSFGWLDQARLKKVRGPSGDATWERALTEISNALAGSDSEEAGGRIGVIASAQLTNEELFLIREIFHSALGAQISASVPEKPGSSDDFLIKEDKNPNTLGATLLGLAGHDAPEAGQLVDEALDGKLEVLWVFGHDLVELFGEEKVRQLSEKVPLFIFSGTNENPTVPRAHWVLPTAAYVEKDGTFVNCHGRVQRIGCAFPPLGDSREDWRILLDLAGKLGLSLHWQGPEEIFQGLAEELAPFQGLSYETIGTQGVEVATAGPPAGAAAP
ncbi:2Fe-2S iron-sulfur cluster-binding protein [Acidobacteria bacterium AH-259-D05]|nr:2Fe-2S iron-sulfur cluster-binding protein [Acidobacteria bacterium AH-259-D05]